MTQTTRRYKIDEFCYVTDYVANGSFASLKENVQYLDNDGFAILVRLADFTKGWNGPFKYVSEKAYRFLSKSSLRSGDLIMSNVGEPGKVFRVPDLDKPMTLGPNAILIRPDAKVASATFLYYYFSSDLGRAAIREISEGVAQNKFNKTSFRRLEIGIPPLTEQQRIVAILDQAFEAIDTAINSARVAKERVDSVFSRYLDSLFARRGKEWLEHCLGDMAQIRYGYTASAQTADVGPKFLRITDIQDNRVEWSKVPNCVISRDKHEKYRLRSGDIVFARTGATTGKSYVIDEPPDAVFASYLIRVRLSRDVIEPRFAHLYLRTADYWNAIREGATGSTQGGFNASKLSALTIPLPAAPEEQRLMVEAAQVVEEETRRLKTLYESKLDAYNRLRASLLNRAFAGRL